MLVVLDTNVLVSGLLKAGSPPGKIVERVLARKIQLAVDERIMQEYAEVTARPRLKIAVERRNSLLTFIAITSIRIKPAQLALPAALIPDPKDLPFAEVAITAKVDALLTGISDILLFCPRWVWAY